MNEQKTGIIMTVPYFQVPNDIFKQGLKTSELAVYFYLARCGNQGNAAFPSYSSIVKNCSITKPTAISVVRSLEEKGIIVKRKRWSEAHEEYYSNMYVVRHEFQPEQKEEDQAPNDSLIALLASFAECGATAEPTAEVKAMAAKAIKDGKAKTRARARWG